MVGKHVVPAILCAFALAAGLNAVASGAAPEAGQMRSFDRTSEYWPAVKGCLAVWGESHPFKDESKLRFYVIEAPVRIMGGGADVTDDTETSEPRLILVRPAVNIMGSIEFNLMNPNGWYCLEGSVTVMARSEINLACAAHMASGGSGATVMGSSPGKGETTVMGKTTIKRKCK